MTRSIYATPLHRSLIAATAGAALALTSGAHAQFNDGGPSPAVDFTHVLNFPGALAPNYGIDPFGDVGGTDLTQININAGAALSFGYDYHFSEVNVYANTSAPGGNDGAQFINSQLNLIAGGIFGSDLSIDANSTLNMSGGEIGAYSGTLYRANISGVANVSGGMIHSDSGLSAIFNSTLNLSGAGAVGAYATATNGSVINMSGGTIGSNFSLQDGATLNLTGGTLGPTAGGQGGGVDALTGSQVNMSGGSLAYSSKIRAGAALDMTGGTLRANADIYGVANISGGTVEKWFDVNAGAVANITGGEFNEFDVMAEKAADSLAGGVANVSGGSFGDFELFNGAVANISGGTYATNFDINEGGTANLTGTEFFVNGEAFLGGEVLARIGVLTGTLLDGSEISLSLSDTDSSTTGYVHTGGILNVTLVPEPSSLALIGLGGLALIRRRR